LFSFAECFAQKVEEMILQHLSILSMKGHKLDGLKIEVNLRQAKCRFSLCETSCLAQFKPDVMSYFGG